MITVDGAKALLLERIMAKTATANKAGCLKKSGEKFEDYLLTIYAGGLARLSLCTLP
jgi:hypothetical protein